MVDDAVLEYIHKKNKKLKVKFGSITSLNQSARLVDKTHSWKEWIQIIIHFQLIFSCETV